MTAPAGTLAVKNLDTPDDKRSFEHGDVRMVHIAGAIIARADFNPGWRWSTDVKPVVGTGSCQGSHTSYVVSGRLHVRMDDGRECELGPGDAHVVGPGHDAWVVGDEPCVTVDFIKPEDPAPTGARVARCPCGVQFSVEDEDGLDHLIAAIQQHEIGRAHV